MKDLYLWTRELSALLNHFKEILGNEENRRNLICKIMDTRNDLTHSNLDLISQTAEDRDLWTLYLKTELIFQLLLLWSIGFSLEDINSVVANCGQLQWKLNQQL